MQSTMFETMRRKMGRFKYYKTPMLVIFSFLFGCMVTINLTPLDKTCRMEDSDRENNIMKNSKFKSPDLIILIFSAPKNLDKRNVARQTWLQLYDTTPESENVKFKMKYYFVVGSLGLSVDEVFHLSTEQSQFSDILILPMYDGYENLTVKLMKSFEWLSEQSQYGSDFRYVLKCDDDSFVRIDNLAVEVAKIELLCLKSAMKRDETLTTDTMSMFISTNVQTNKNAVKNEFQLYWGYFSGNARVKNSGKWKESNWIMCDKYVPYALGGGYILSKNLVSFIANNKDSLRYYNSEDVSVGAWLSSVADIVRVHDTRFDTEWTTRGCQNYYLITHNISKDEMHKMYETLISTNNLCKVPTIKRRYYLYNWTLPPSECCKFNENNK